MTATRVVIDSFGGPDVMRLEEVALPLPGSQEVLVRHTAIGFNFIDVYDREGRNGKLLPSVLGREAAGVVEAIGPDVSDFDIGDRVACIDAGLGTYSDRRIVKTSRLIRIPDDIDDETVAAVLMKAMTAHYLLHKTYAVKAGDLVLINAAAGGVGQIMCRWAKALGAEVVGTVGSDAKVDVAKVAGADFVINYAQPKWSDKVLEATGGRKADVVYDSVGKDTFFDSIECVAPLGMMVLAGAASGPIPPVSPSILKKKGGLFLTSPSLAFHNKTPDALRDNARIVFEAIRRGVIVPQIGARYALADIVKLHRDAQARRLVGSTVILP